MTEARDPLDLILYGSPSIDEIIDELERGGRVKKSIINKLRSFADGIKESRRKLNAYTQDSGFMERHSGLIKLADELSDAVESINQNAVMQSEYFDAVAKAIEKNTEYREERGLDE